MPSHIKSTIIGVSITIPITNGKLNLGTWQGIYLNEHRNHGSMREIVGTILVIRSYKVFILSPNCAWGYIQKQ